MRAGDSLEVSPTGGTSWAGDSLETCRADGLGGRCRLAFGKACYASSVCRVSASCLRDDCCQWSRSSEASDEAQSHTTHSLRGSGSGSGAVRPPRPLSLCCVALFGTKFVGRVTRWRLSERFGRRAAHRPCAASLSVPQGRLLPMVSFV